MQASAHLTGRTLGLQAGDAALVCLNIRYVAGVMMLVRGLELGLFMTIVEPLSNPLADADSATTTYSFTALVPLQLQTILASGADKVPILNQMKAILVGGAATSQALEQELQRITAPIYATYGMTETVSHIALRRLNGPQKENFFTALDGVVLGTDERGCLHITAAATDFERIQTNDVVDLLDPVHFRLLGRADRIINSGGIKVQPERVEQVIQTVLAEQRQPSSALVPRLFVTGWPDERLGQRVIVVVEGAQKAWTDAEWETVQEAIRHQLGAYSVPKEVIYVEPFAETSTGKIDQQATIARIR
ncbi:AMP-binding protein [Spirosoma koreense]